VDLVQKFIEQAKQKPLRVVYPEGDDERIVMAAAKVKALGIARPILLGNREAVTVLAQKNKVSLDGVSVVDPATDAQLAAFVKEYLKGSAVKEAVALKMMKKPLFFGGMMVKMDAADAMVGGVACATATFIQASSLTVGLAPGINTPSSFFLMILPEFQGIKDKVLVFADCAVNVQPTARQLAEIGVATAENAAKLLGIKPKVAFLSFSTKGSASHADTEKVVQAMKIARELKPGLEIDGELQGDAALIPRVGNKKAPGSPVAGAADVLVFPDLDAGNIAYKLVQYCGNAKALGPILQGFAKPVNDMSRGASVDDLVGVTAITVVRGQE
jgi:phosphate acetyltransferase